MTGEGSRPLRQAQGPAFPPPCTPDECAASLCVGGLGYCRAILSRGSTIAATIGAVKKPTTEMTMPAIAWPLPPNWPWLLLIFASAMIPSANPTREPMNGRIQMDPRMPKMRDAVAMPQVSAG